jgi:proteic killer suppression protein
MILSFKCRHTKVLAEGYRVNRFENVERVARRKLRQLEIANDLGDLMVPPGNQLKALKGDRRGQYSIRINDPFRICFRWSEGGPEDVEIVDYH